MNESPDDHHGEQQEHSIAEAPARDDRGRYKPGTCGNPAGRFKPGQSGNPKGRPPGRGFRETVLRLLDNVDDEGVSQAEQLAAMLLGAAMGGDMRAADLLIRRLWPEGQKARESVSGGHEMENGFLRAQMRTIRDHVQKGTPIPEDSLRDLREPSPWSHEMEGMSLAECMQHIQKRRGTQGKPGDARKPECEEATP